MIKNKDIQRQMSRILRFGRPRSQAEMSRKLNVSRPTMHRAVRLMKEEGFLVDIRNTSGGKRPALGLNPNFGHVVGLEYNSEMISSVVVTFEGRIVLADTHNLQVSKPVELLEALASTAKKAISAVNLSEGKLLGVTVIDCGVVDINEGVAVRSSLFPAWHDVKVTERLSSILGVPVSLMSSSPARVMAVDRLELGGRYDDIITLEYGAGIACGLKMGGDVIFGSRGMSGELGHTHVTDSTEPCSCGSLGCLEAVAALPALARQAGRDGREVLADAKVEDKLAMRIVHQAFERIGTALGNLVNVLNPAIIVLPPIMAEAGEAALDSLRRAMHQQMMPTHAEKLEIKVSELKEPIAPIGGALWSLERFTLNKRV